MRSKAHWGDDREFLELVCPILTFTEEDLAESPVYVVLEAKEDEPLGIYRPSGSPPEGELEDLWLDPRLIGRGVGCRLFEHALRPGRSEGSTRW